MDCLCNMNKKLVLTWPYGDFSELLCASLLCMIFMSLANARKCIHMDTIFLLNSFVQVIRVDGNVCASHLNTCIARDRNDCFFLVSG